VRARDETDQHVDRNRRKTDELAESSEGVRDDEQHAEDEQIVPHGSAQGWRVGSASRLCITRTEEVERLGDLLGDPATTRVSPGKTLK